MSTNSELPSSLPAVTPLTISVEQAAAVLGIGRTIAYRLVRTGELRSVKIGRRRLVVRASIAEYVERLEATGS